MMLIVLVLLAVTANGIYGKSSCSIENGSRVKIMNGDRILAVNVPCKYNAIKQKCGPYQVTVTPGQQFLYPSYTLKSVFFSVKDINDTTKILWKGFTNIRKVALSIMKNTESPFEKSEGSLETEALFKTEKTSKEAVITEKSGVFSISFGAYDLNGGKNKDSTFKFTCNEDDQGTKYPTQLCGDTDGKALFDRAELLWKKKSVKELSKTMLLDIFNDNSIVQTDDNCKAATSVMTKQCTTPEQKKMAINTCHRILDNKPYTQCVFRYTCTPMDTFVECLKFACSGFDDKQACEEIANDIDLCRNFPILTDQVKDKCRPDLLTSEYISN